MPILVTDMKLNKLEWFSLVDKGASGNKKHQTKVVLWKRDKSLADRIKSIFAKKGAKPVDVKKQEPAMPTLEEILGKLSEEEQKVIMDALAATAAPVVPAPVVAQEQPNPEEPKPEEMQKLLKVEIEKLAEGNALRSILEKKLEEMEETAKENIDLQKRIEDLEARGRMIEMEKRVEDLAFLPMSNLELAKTLASAEDSMDDKQYKAFEGMLEKINSAMEASPVFTEHGSAENDGEETAVQKRDKMVVELRKKHPSLKERQARVRVYKANPGLAAEVETETRIN